MDISGFEDEGLKIIGGLVGAGAIWLIKRGITLLGYKLSVERQAALERALDKVLTFAVVKAEQVIAEKGWDHVDSKNAVISVALQALPEKFPDALTAAKLDLSKPADRAAVVDQMTRMIPEVFAKAATSPATPPAPPQQAIVVSATALPLPAAAHA
jgi:hypothetical protein